jgi:oligopeptide/dipeptide ABC transporter ATP-binding protein
MEEVLKIEDLRTYFYTDEGVARAVDGVSLSVGKKQTLGLVGESGCGKSMTALSILRLVPTPPGRIVSGRITLGNVEILSLPEVRMRDIRGKLASMIFQEPMTSLNPVFTIGNQVVEAVRLHTRMSPSEAQEIAFDYLAKVGIPAARERFSQYPHQLSGGMKQRVMIAMALCLRPELLIADEPTTALDVTIQAGILRLMKEMQEETEAAILLITHDLGVIAEMADHVAVMYAGKIVETGPSDAIFASFLHPYTEGLFKSLPGRTARGQKLYTIAGNVPSALQFQYECCRFHTRCPLAREKCREEEPPLVVVSPDHRCACWDRAGEGPP